MRLRHRPKNRRAKPREVRRDPASCTTIPSLPPPRAFHASNPLICGGFANCGIVQHIVDRLIHCPGQDDSVVLVSVVVVVSRVEVLRVVLSRVVVAGRVVLSRVVVAGRVVLSRVVVAGRVVLSRVVVLVIVLVAIATIPVAIILSHVTTITYR